MSKWTYINGDAIFTDASWITLSYQESLEYFPKEEIEEWWIDYTSEMNIEELCEELEIDVPDEKDEDAIEYILGMLPKCVSIIVAKACYKHEKWMSIIAIPDGTPFFDAYERKAILLGVKLREQLSINVPIVNDNRNAVKEMKEKYPCIQWARRNKTKDAHDFSFKETTKLIKSIT